LYVLSSPSPETSEMTTPELQHLVAQQARSLQLRLNHGRVDPITAAGEARRLFTEVGDDVHVRWLGLELNGYGELAHAVPLHVLLRVPAADRLTTHVAAYRTQRGLLPGPNGTPSEFRHFFVESLAQLIDARATVAGSDASSRLELAFTVSTSTARHPSSGSFGRDVFDRIVAGFVAALYLQLGVLTR
jgi:hypothetical protein